MDKVFFCTYGDDPRDGTKVYDAESLMFSTSAGKIYFSARTPIAFRAVFLGGGLVVRENEWGLITGRHMSWLDGGNYKERIPGNQFMDLLKHFF